MIKRSSFIDTSVDEFRRILDINVVGLFLLAKHSIDFLKLENGSIINIGSTHAIATSYQIAAYACSKAAIVGLTRNIAIELAKYGILVNCVSPGSI